MLFTGSARGKLVDRIRANGWGRLFAAEKPAPRPEEPWALDNGVFGAWKSGEPWLASKFLRALEQSTELHKPVFAVIPDIVGGGNDSIAHSLRWLAVLPSMPWYLAVQDGMTPAAVERVLPNVAGLFLGGTDEFKATAPAWCELAHKHGKKFHYARISTENRIRAALDCGADSADSSQMLWSREHFTRFERWWNDAHAQMRLTA